MNSKQGQAGNSRQIPAPMEGRNMFTRMKSIASLAAIAACSAFAIGSAQAATIFETNINGNAAALDGTGTGDTTQLPWDVADQALGGPTVGVTTHDIFFTTSVIDMNATGMGLGNILIGGGQEWVFSFDDEVSFDGIAFGGADPVQYQLQSDAWIGATETGSSSDWTFVSANGSFELTAGSFSTSYDLTGSSILSNIAPGTQMSILRYDGGNGQLESFTLSPGIPEPASLALLGLGGLLIARRK